MTTASRGTFTADVISNVSLCREHYRLTLRIPDFPPSAPGQFVQLECREPCAGDVDHAFDWSIEDRPTIVSREFLGHEAFLRRPFSIAGRRGDEIDLIGREVGTGTRFLARLEAGDTLSLVGPLGNTFELPGDVETALLVGGGVGIPPMIYVAQAIAERGVGSAVAFAGALTHDLMSLTIDATKVAVGEPTDAIAEFDRFGVKAALTTDDGTLGLKGFVTEALERYLDANPTGQFVIFTCGPEPMMKRVQAIGAARGIRVQIAVERAMACGMGTCQSCCIRVKKPDPAAPPLAGREWCYRLACTDGPVFEGDALLW